MRARENPFNVDCVLRLRYRPQNTSWDALHARLAAFHYRGAIVGPEGAGKTTLLEDLQEQLTKAGWQVPLLRLTRDQPFFHADAMRRFLRPLTSRHIILFDGAEQLAWWRWRQFLWQTRGAGGLVITCHRPGRLPTLIECRTSVELAEELVAKLVGPLDASLRAIVEELFLKHRGNVREVLRALYDISASSITETHVVNGDVLRLPRSITARSASEGTPS